MDAALGVGLDQLSMNAVARRLGVSTPALYRYVRDKDALLTLCMDRFCDRLVLPETRDWQNYLKSLANAFLEVLVSMPGAADYGSRLGPSTPAAFAIVDHSLGVLRESGFSPSDAWLAYSSTVNLAFDVARRNEQRPLLNSSGERPDFTIFHLPEAVMVELPNLEWSLSAHLLMGKEWFDASLQCVIDGLAHRVQADKRTGA